EEVKAVVRGGKQRQRQQHRVPIPLVGHLEHGAALQGHLGFIFADAQIKLQQVCFFGVVPADQDLHKRSSLVLQDHGGRSTKQGMEDKWEATRAASPL